MTLTRPIIETASPNHIRSSGLSCVMMWATWLMSAVAPVMNCSASAVFCSAQVAEHRVRHVVANCGPGAGTQVTMNWDNWGAFGVGNGFFGPSAQFVEDGSFVKLRDVSLTFTLTVTDNLEACITVLLAQHNRFVLAFRDEQSPVGKQAAEVLRAAGRPGHLEAGLRRPPEAEQEARVAAR